MELGEAVVVVHGTFASGADWIQPGSQFLQSLGRRIGKRAIHAFIWSGANSHKARTEAGDELARFVDRLCSTESVRRVWCVTHSHGGNVALYALRDDQFAQRLAGIAFFGTPFLHVHRRNLQRFCGVFTMTFFWFLLIMMAILIPAILISAITVEIGQIDEDKVDLILGIWVPTWFWAGLTYGPQLRQYADHKLMAFLSGKQDEICGWLAQPRPACPTYTATVARDEAAVLLTSIDDISAMPWIGLAGVNRAVLTVVVTYLALSFGAPTVFDLPDRSADLLINIVLGVPLLVILGPFLATPFVAAFRGTRLAFGSEGLIAASTVRIRPSQVPTWDGDNACRVQYPPNKSVRGYRHCFFYSDEHVINDVAAWIQSNGQIAGSPVFGRAAKPRTAVQAFVARWFIPAATAISMIVTYTWLTLAKIRELSGVKFDLASDARSIQDGAAPVLEIDRTFKGKMDTFGGTAFTTPSPFSYFLHEPEVLDTALGVSPGTTCVVEGEATLFSWDKSLEIAIYIHEPRPLSDAEKKQANYENFIDVGGQRFFDEYQREVWNWNASGGKEVHFRRRFRNKLPPPTARLALRVWNKSFSPARVMVRMYAQCS